VFALGACLTLLLSHVSASLEPLRLLTLAAATSRTPATAEA